MKSLFTTLDSSSQHSRSTVEAVLQTRRGDEQYKAFMRTWKTADVIQMLNITSHQQTKASGELNISPEKIANRYEYSLDQIQQIRAHLTQRQVPSTLPVVSVMSGKGGCSKTTFSVYLAQRLVSKASGYCLSIPIHKAVPRRYY